MLLSLNYSVSKRTVVNDFVEGELLGSELKLRGEIKPGDAEKLVATLISSRTLGKNGQPMYLGHIIHLDSPGGDIAESLKIAAVVKSSYLNIWVGDGKKPRPAICASSCFLIYLAGAIRYAIGSDVPAGWKWSRVNQGIIGIHRPFFANVSGGPASQSRQENLMRAMRDKLRDSGLGQNLIDEMMSRPSNEVYWLTTSDLTSIGQYSPGMEEEMIAKCGYRRNQDISTDATHKEFLMQINCTSTQIEREYGPLKQANFEKMRSGWRPW